MSSLSLSTALIRKGSAHFLVRKKSPDCVLSTSSVLEGSVTCVDDANFICSVKQTRKCYSFRETSRGNITVLAK